LQPDQHRQGRPAVLETARGECQEAATALAASVAVLRTHIAWLTLGEGA
jgi:hypothetical protein